MFVENAGLYLDQTYSTSIFNNIAFGKARRLFVSTIICGTAFAIVLL